MHCHISLSCAEEDMHDHVFTDSDGDDPLDVFDYFHLEQLEVEARAFKRVTWNGDLERLERLDCEQEKLMAQVLSFFCPDY